MENKYPISVLKNFDPKDLDEIRDLAKQLNPNFKGLTENELKKIINSPSVFLQVAREKNTKKITGMATLIVYRIPYVKKAIIEDVVVDTNHRQKGIGSMIIKKAIKVAKENGASYIDLTSSPHRKEGNGLYKKLGFEKRETNIYRLKI